MLVCCWVLKMDLSSLNQTEFHLILQNWCLNFMYKLSLCIWRNQQSFMNPLPQFSKLYITYLNSGPLNSCKVFIAWCILLVLSLNGVLFLFYSQCSISPWHQQIRTFTTRKSMWKWSALPLLQANSINLSSLLTFTFI
jgi:hypothetical protein